MHISIFIANVWDLQNSSYRIAYHNTIYEQIHAIHVKLFYLLCSVVLLTRNGGLNDFAFSLTIHIIIMKGWKLQ